LSRRGRPLPEPRTESCRNQRLRLKRRTAWWAAGRLTAYWRARLDWQTALSSAQNHDVADAKSFPPCDDSGSSRLVLVDYGGPRWLPRCSPRRRMSRGLIGSGRSFKPKTIATRT
jgi:hypothetical protein